MGTTPAITCRDCGATIPPTPPGHCGGTGYAVDNEGRNVCYACCAIEDQARMRATGRALLYLSAVSGLERAPTVAFASDWRLTNWPGTLVLPVHRIRKGFHNLARCRYDVWFMFDGQEWHGTVYGDNTQVARCRRLKAREVRAHA